MRLNQGHSKSGLSLHSSTLFGRYHEMVDKCDVHLMQPVIDGINDICLQIVTICYHDIQTDIWRVPDVRLI